MHLRSILVLLAVSMLPAKTAFTQEVISTGPEVALERHLAPEVPTVFVFLRASSAAEQSFLEALRASDTSKAEFRLILLKTDREPAARQHKVEKVPTAIVYDRRGRLVGRSSDPNEIRVAMRRAAGVMRIDWAEEGDSRYEEVSRILGRRPAPGILRTMSLQPEYMRYIHELSMKAHFADGYLDRRTKELIATYVSALNACKY